MNDGEDAPSEVPFVSKPTSAKRSPQEKKQLSYAHDRRNVYGENSRAARKGIPFRKRAVNKANRHHDRQLLDAALGAVDMDRADRTEERARGRLRLRWTKVADEPLGEHIQQQARKRERRSER